MKKTAILFLTAGVFFACNQPVKKNKAEKSFETQLQERLLSAKAGDVIEIAEGTHKFTRSLSLDGIDNVTIKGAGKDKTILSFKEQIEGAEGLKITANGIIISDLTVQDTKGDAIKVQESDGVTFRNVGVTWTNGPDSANGAYGLYPVTCKNVLIENCEASAASDAGIYVGQSEHIVVRNCKVWENVAGIEIENSIYADVYDNEAYNNTGGVLIFDLPELPKKNGHHIRVYNNNVHDNNLPNFSPIGNTVALVPAGTGMLILATREVEFFNNTVKNHKTTSLAVVSYMTTEKPFTDSLYNPFPSAIYVHDNTFEQTPAMPDTSRALGKLTAMLFQGNSPHILFDGFADPAATGEDGRICIKNNGEISFANINAPSGFKEIKTDLAEYDCELSRLSEVEL
ncbi:MAG: hypothetical protein COA57_10130 [Flavobacteriales bacterium]|nr:MAG: hypothetical protein COA57_10130 [Flavobacteriales bacterium]